MQILKHIQIPKFKQRFKLDLKPALMKLLPNALHFIDAIIHETVIEVDETGTEACATTTVYENLTSNLSRDEHRKIVFIADHPFIFYIRHTPSKTLLFVGNYN